MVELPDGTRLLHAIKPGEKLPMQFGREVSANLCMETLPRREGWKLSERKCWDRDDMAISVG
jgi:hypothetical protein